MSKQKFPRYVYIEALLLDGKIWKCNVRYDHKEAKKESILFPEGFSYTTEEFQKRFAMFSCPIFIKSEEERKEIENKAVEMFKMFPIHEDYKYGIRPY